MISRGSARPRRRSSQARGVGSTATAAASSALAGPTQRPTVFRPGRTRRRHRAASCRSAHRRHRRTTRNGRCFARLPAPLALGPPPRTGAGRGLPAIPRPWPRRRTERGPWARVAVCPRRWPFPSRSWRGPALCGSICRGVGRPQGPRARRRTLHAAPPPSPMRRASAAVRPLAKIPSISMASPCLPPAPPGIGHIPPLRPLLGAAWHAPCVDLCALLANFSWHAWRPARPCRGGARTSRT